MRCIIKQRHRCKHRRWLDRQGAVDTRREGKFIWYRLADARTLQLMQAMYQLFCAPAPAAAPQVERSAA